MEIIKIRDWLVNPKKTFAEGKALYDRFKTSTKLDALLNSKPSFEPGTIQFNILQGELNRIFRIKQQQTPDLAAKKTEEKPVSLINTKQITLGEPKSANQRRAESMRIVNHNPAVEYNALPPDLKAAFDEIKELSKTLSGLKAITVDKKATPQDRKDAADELCRKFDKRASLWKQLDDWAAQNNITNPIKGDDIPSKDEIKSQIKKKRDEINRSLKNNTPKDPKKREAKIKKLEGEIVKLEALQNADA